MVSMSNLLVVCIALMSCDVFLDVGLMNPTNWNSVICLCCCVHNFTCTLGRFDLF